MNKNLQKKNCVFIMVSNEHTYFCEVNFLKKQKYQFSNDFKTKYNFSYKLDFNTDSIDNFGFD